MTLFFVNGIIEYLRETPPGVLCVHVFIPLCLSGPDNKNGYIARAMNTNPNKTAVACRKAANIKHTAEGL